MKRREWMKAAGFASAALALPRISTGATPAEGMAGRSTVETEVVRLKLRHTWTTTMSSSDYRDTLQVRFSRGGLTGVGEGAPIVRYKEDALSAQKVVDAAAAALAAGDPRSYRKLLGGVFARIEGQQAAKAAMDIAVMDWVGRTLGVPLHALYGLDQKDAPVTTFSIGIDTPEITRQKVKEAEAYPILKIKVGLDTDEATIEAVRSVTKKPLRVDANEGWRDKEEAVRKINWLESQGVEFVEQPMPAEMIEETRWVRSKVHLPIIADESCVHLRDIPRLAEAFDGVNVKLDKAGGTLEALRMLELARALGLKTMLGCMVSSSVSVTAAAHLSPLVDYADLDGNLLIANDPYTGVRVEAGRLILPSGPGLGITPVAKTA